MPISGRVARVTSQTRHMHTARRRILQAFGQNVWVLEVYFMGIQVPLQQYQCYNALVSYGSAAQDRNVVCRVARTSDCHSIACQ